MPPNGPVSGDNITVLLWLVGTLTGALGVAVITLWRMMVTNADACRDETKELHAKIDQMHETRAEAETKREAQLVEVVAAMTQAITTLKDEIGSGLHRIIADHDAARRREG